MKVLVIVAAVLSCTLAAPTDLLKAYNLPLLKTIEYKPVEYSALPYHGLPHHGLVHAVEKSADDAEEVEEDKVLVPVHHALPYHHGLPHTPVIHSAPVHYTPEVKSIAIKHEPIKIEYAEPRVVEVSHAPVEYHTRYHAETERIEHPVNINHHTEHHTVHQVHHVAPVTYTAVHPHPAAYTHLAGYAHKVVKKEE